MTATPHYSLSWSDHLNTIASGLSSLQQNEEFVDMTLAADGHYIKVHKVIMALASPYIKEILSSMKCDHPTIFLNKVSYKTLAAILEYVYTGEVFVQFENIDEFIATARELHIRGLKDLNFSNETKSEQLENTLVSTNYESDDCYVERLSNSEPENLNMDVTVTVEDLYDVDKINSKVKYRTDDTNEGSQLLYQDSSELCIPTLQYTVSNRGSLQMILNKFLYYLKHTNKDLSRQWRCVDYLSNRKCPALIFTRDDVVIQRIAAHNHPVHDDKIYKKTKTGAVFTAIKDVFEKGLVKLPNKHDLETE